jgi:hypothetical protein
MRSYRSYPYRISNTSAILARAGIHFDLQANGFPLSYQMSGNDDTTEQ